MKEQGRVESGGWRVLRTLHSPPATLHSLLLLSLAACATVRGTVHSYAVAPSGLEVREERLRDLLAAGRFDASLQRVASRKQGAPEDELLRLLYRGTVAYYAGEYDASARALQRAYDLTEDRYTKSATKGALALLTNDRALPYVPGQNERLMVHYYAMQGFLRRGAVSEATVEARRMSSLLQQFEQQSPAPEDRSTRAVLRYLAGAVFEAAGERADAEVAYRNARALAPDSLLPGDPPIVRAAGRDAGMPRVRRAAGLAAPASGDSSAGEVIVVLEEGFVAHRVGQTLSIALTSDDMRHFRDGDDASKASAAAGIGDRILLHLAGADPTLLDEEDDDAWGRDWGGSSSSDRPLEYLLQISWPAYRRSYHPSRLGPSVLADSVRIPLRFSADLSDAAAGDYRRDRAKILARAIARAATKYALAELAERDAKKQDDEVKTDREGEKGGADPTGRKRHRRDHDEKDRWLKGLVNAAGVALERADTRSWHLLPGAISVARLTLPAGRHTLAFELSDAAGGLPRRVVLEDVDVRPGSIAFVSGRLWQEGQLAAAAPAPAARQ
jgi:tetratricopeptide (TPR) repeat protein